MSSDNMSYLEQQAQAEKNAPTETEMIYQGRIFDLRLDKITGADGQVYKREIIVHPGAVVMIPIDALGRIVLIQQWRRAAGQIMIELPAGTLEKGEEPRQCAQRELQEEIGFISDKLTDLGGFFSAPGFCTEYLYLFLAEELRPDKLAPDEREYIEILPTFAEEALQMIERGEICDAKTVAGITRYYLRQELGLK